MWRVDRLRRGAVGTARMTGGEAVQLATERWFRQRTSGADDYPLELLLQLKRDSRVSVVLPARDEAATVGEIVAALHRELVSAGLVDEVVVIDSHSTDDTAEVAEAAGAVVVHQADLLPDLGDRPGKGEAMWKSLSVASGDLIVFLDADLEQFSPTYVTGLLGPLLTDSAVQYVKGMYERPLSSGATVLPAGGGRVTELVARPLLNQFWPELAGIVQPLAGEYAARREVLERVPFVSGYGVELGLLIDLLDLVGLDALAQVDLGRRVHRHQSDEALGRMAMQIQLTAFRRLERQGRLVGVAAPQTALTQFRRRADRFVRIETDVDVAERPPLIDVPEYRLRDRDRFVLDSA
jgi:glucosyl-3-phosphoglycerate synthase